MNPIIVGINHTTASIAVREQFFLTSTEQDLLLSKLRSNPAVLESFVLSTCNRTEIYASVLDGYNFFAHITQTLARIKKVRFNTDTVRHFYTHCGTDAVDHLFRVACGLNSLVLGEKQILGQLRLATERGREAGMFSRDFNILSNLALRAGKKAQTETSISYGGSSVSSAAVRTAETLLGTLKDRSMLIIGAGKMGELTVRQIRQRGTAHIFLMNRTQAIAEELAAKIQATAVNFCDIKETLTDVDVCICASGAPHYILDKPLVERVMARRQDRPLVLIDISMPRNIDPAVSGISGVSLTAIDDLAQAVEATMARRREAVPAVERIIADKIRAYDRKRQHLVTATY